MIFKRVARKKQAEPPIKEKKIADTERVPPIPGAVPLKFDAEIQFEAAAGPVRQGNDPFYVIQVGRGKFHLSDQSRLTAELKASVTQYARVDFWIYAAVFDDRGSLLGTASHREEVLYIRTGGTPTVFREIKLDFGISDAFQRAAYVVVTIGERKVPDPNAKNR
jgi:hypothetical protein